MKTITRSKLREAVEYGIGRAPAMTDAQKAMLRHVAATTDRVVYGTFRHRADDGQECGCPLTLAGLAPVVPYKGITIAPGAAGFFGPFDHKMNALLGVVYSWRERVVEVKG